MTQVLGRFKLLGLVLTAVFLSSIITGTAMAAYQSHMYMARNNLQNALTQLNQATPDKAGHRVSAINLVNQAITQVNWGIRAGAR